MTLKQADLAQFTGSQNLYYLPLFKKFNYTDGIKYLAKEGEAYWLIEAIFSWQCEKIIENNPDLKRLQIWTLEVEEDKTATLACWRDTDDLIVSQNIDYTDFPLSSVKLFLCDKILMLPTEY